MPNKFQRETSFWKFPTTGILLGLLCLLFFSSPSFQLTNRVPDSRNFLFHPTKIAATDPHKIPGKTANYFIEEIEEENKEEKFPKYSLGTASTTFGTDGLKPALIFRTLFNPRFVFYHKVSLYILFQSLRLDLA